MSNVFKIVKDALSDRPKGDLKYSIIVDRFVNNLTQTEVGIKQNLSREKIRQLEDNAFRELRNPKYKKLQAYAEYVADKSIYHSGLKEFKYTHTSGVEWAVLKLEAKVLTPEI